MMYKMYITTWLNLFNMSHPSMGDAMISSLEGGLRWVKTKDVVGNKCKIKF